MSSSRCFFAAALWVSTASLAQSPGPDQSDLDQALVDQERNAQTKIASGSEESRALAAANITTVSYDAISQRGYRSIADLLRDVVGIYVIDDGVLPALSVRGVSGGVRAGTRIVRIMINGVEVNFRPDLTSFIGPEFIPMAMVERVEIARGPLSALYGANAFLATINVVTRGQAGGAPLIAEGSLRGHLNGGNFGMGGTVLAGYEETNHSLLMSVSADRFDRSGLSITPTFGTQDADRSPYREFLNRSSSNDTSFPVSAFAQYAATSKTLGKLSLQAGLQRLDSAAEFQLASALTHLSRVQLENDFASARYEKRFGTLLDIDVRLGWSRGLPLADEKLFLTANTQSYYTRNFKYTSLNGQALVALRPLEAMQFEVKAGVDFNVDWQDALSFNQVLLSVPAGSGRNPTDVIRPVFPTSDPAKFAMTDIGIPLQVSLTPGRTGLASRLRFTVNGRLDFFNFFPVQYSWRAGAAWVATDQFSLKLVAGRAFQAPSGVMLFAQPNFGTTSNVSGNLIRTNQLLVRTPKLQPQVVNSIELGASGQLFGRLSLEGSVFGQMVDDLIQFARSGADFKAVNQGRLGSAGVELGATLTAGRLSMFAVGSFQKTLIAENPNAIIETDRPNLNLAPSSFPTVQGVLGVNVAVPEAHLNLNARLRGVGPRGSTQSNALLANGFYELPAYGHFDGSISTLGLNVLGGSQTVVAFTVRNLLDTRENEPGFGGFDTPSMGRTMMLELKQTY